MWLSKDVLLADFGHQCTNLQNQYARMHGRMQLITGLNTALPPTLGAPAVAAGKKELDSDWLVLFPIAGLLLSTIGFVAGSADHKLVDICRRQLAWAALSIVCESGVVDPNVVYNTWFHAGRSPSVVDRDLLGPGELFSRATPGVVHSRVLNLWYHLTSWRLEPLSVTRLPAVLSLVFIVVWVVVLVLLASGRP